MIEELHECGNLPRRPRGEGGDGGDGGGENTARERERHSYETVERATEDEWTDREKTERDTDDREGGRSSH